MSERLLEGMTPGWVIIDLSWFGICRIIPLAKKVYSSLFESITTPSSDIDSVKEVLNMLKRHGKKLIPSMRYPVSYLEINSVE